jgi:hypothetical protein
MSNISTVRQFKKKKVFYSIKLNRINTKLFFIVLLTFISNSFSQKQFTILDTSDYSTIPFCKILLKEKSKVYYSNEFGSFEHFGSLENGDSLSFVSYGYINKYIIYSENLNDTIFLIPESKNIFIDEVIIRPKNWTDLTLNEFENPDFGYLTLLKGGIIATYIQNSKFASGKINKVDVYIKSLDSSYYLKMKLFNYDIIHNCPSKEIKISDVIVDFTGEAKWYTIELKDTIYVPIEGLCVGFEVIPKNNILEIDKKQCSKSSVVFSSYYEKLENGNRTSYTSLSNNNWNTPQSNNLKVENVLNLSVRVNIYGELNLPIKDEPKFVSTKKVVRKLNAKSNNVNLNHSTIEDLFKSLIICIEKNDLVGASSLIVINKENKSQFNEFVKQNNDNWLTETEIKNALIEWKYYLENLSISNYNFISPDYLEIVFPNKNNLFIYRDIDGWKISPYHKKIVN